MVDKDLKNRLVGFAHMMNLAIERKEKDEIIADFANWLNTSYILNTTGVSSSLSRMELFDKVVETTSIEDLIDMVVGKEYIKAVERYGQSYNSWHEASAILREEIEEADKEFGYLNSMNESFWRSVKMDDFDGLKEYAKEIKEQVNKAIIELAQTRVVLEKIGYMEEE